MKANEAPEKIYIHEASAPELTEKLPYHLEYVRKDAFIEKAQSFFRQSHHLYALDGVELKHFIDDFRKVMKGE